MDEASSKLARVMFEALVAQMPDGSHWRTQQLRAPWMESPFIDAARAALSLLLNDKDIAEVLTRE